MSYDSCLTTLPNKMKLAQFQRPDPQCGDCRAAVWRSRRVTQLTVTTPRAFERPDTRRGALVVTTPTDAIIAATRHE